LRLGQGWRHVGQGQKLAREIAGAEGVMLRALAEAWEIVALLVVEPEVLAAAEATQAVDAKLLAWARARGLVS
jgi:hypothetical protein